MNTPTRPQCCTCRYWVPGQYDNELLYHRPSQCHRQPQELNKRSDDWCGEYQPQDAAEPPKKSTTRGRGRPQDTNIPKNKKEKR